MRPRVTTTSCRESPCNIFRTASSPGSLGLVVFQIAWCSWAHRVPCPGLLALLDGLLDSLGLSGLSCRDSVGTWPLWRVGLSCTGGTDPGGGGGLLPTSRSRSLLEPTHHVGGRTLVTLAVAIVVVRLTLTLALYVVARPTTTVRIRPTTTLAIAVSTRTLFGWLPG